MGKFGCCLDCSVRVVGCHSKCEDYQKERQVKDAKMLENIKKLDMFPIRHKPCKSKNILCTHKR